MELFEKKADKKRRMLAAAYECFTEGSAWDTTINDICSKAGVAKGTFYLYFDGKEEIYKVLINYCSKYVQSQIYDRIHDVDFSSEEEIMLRILDELADIAQTMDKMFQFVGPRLKWPSMDDENVFTAKLESVLDVNSTEEEKNNTLRVMFELLYLYSALIYASLSGNAPVEIEKCKEDLTLLTKHFGILTSVVAPAITSGG